MKLIVIPNELKTEILSDIGLLIGNDISKTIGQNYSWIQYPSGIWLLSKNHFQMLSTIISNIDKKNLIFSGFYLGIQRRQFALSFESLHFLKNSIKRFIIIKDKPLEKFLYGKEVKINTKVYPNNDSIEISYKIIILNNEKNPVGIASLAKISSDNIKVKLKLRPIVDAGIFLRNEQQVFA